MLIISFMFPIVAYKVFMIVLTQSAFIYEMIYLFISKCHYHLANLKKIL